MRIKRLVGVSGDGIGNKVELNNGLWLVHANRKFGSYIPTVGIIIKLNCTELTLSKITKKKTV